MTVPPTSSASAPTSAPHWPSWPATAPRLVAESFVAVSDPLAAWLRPGPPAGAADVAAALAQAMLPPAARDAPPIWLRPDQSLSFQRALAAVRCHRGALLADGVGSGKSWIALAVAQRLEPSRPAIVVAPATLRSQWHDIAGRAGVGILFHSHEVLSRGRPPPAGNGLLILDESHRFRNPGTRRYRILAPWCVGRRGLLLSATPAVNRLDDVAHQLLLLVRDDALAWAGIGSLERALQLGAPGGLCHLLVTGEDRSGALPSRRSRIVNPDEPAGGARDRLLDGIGRLALSRDRAIAELVRVSLLLALASSPSAIAGALRRYRLLLLHAHDALRSGTAVTRQAIRRMVGSLAEQLVLWSLADPGGTTGELDPDDLEMVECLERLARKWCGVPDAKVSALRSIVADGQPSLVFTTAVRSVDYIRNHLGRRGVAWCTGHAAGLDESGTGRDVVLEWFRDARSWSHPSRPAPTVLITTDVAAEGLDLRRVGRVVHYDLPWTAVRLEQRAGRAIRLGTSRQEVELVTFIPPLCIASLLEQEGVLEAKAALPGSLGLGPALEAPWRVRAAAARQWSAHRAIEGVAAVRGASVGSVAGFRMRLADGAVQNVVLGKGPGGWSDDPAAIARLLQQCRTVAEKTPQRPKQLARILDSLAPTVRAALNAANASHLGGGRVTAAIRGARRRLLGLARRAARARQAGRLARCERGLALLRRGLTAGEADEVARWTGLPETALLARLQRLPPPERPTPVVGIDLIGVLAVEPDGRSG